MVCLAFWLRWWDYLRYYWIDSECKSVCYVEARGLPGKRPELCCWCERFWCWTLINSPSLLFFFIPLPKNLLQFLALFKCVTHRTTSAVHNTVTASGGEKVDMENARAIFQREQPLFFHSAICYKYLASLDISNKIVYNASLALSYTGRS